MEAWLGYRLKAGRGEGGGGASFSLPLFLSVGLSPPQGLFVDVSGTWAGKFTVDLVNRERPFAKQAI